MHLNLGSLLRGTTLKTDLVLLPPVQTDVSLGVGEAVSQASLRRLM